MRMLYFGTLLEIPEDILKAQIGLLRAFAERCQVLCIFSKPKPYSFIDKIGNRPICVHGLETQRPMEIGIKIDGGSFLRCFHKGILTPKRLDVNASY
jgi:hypothetical protein